MVATDLSTSETVDVGTSQAYGVPSFFGDDGSLAYTDLDGATPTGASLFVQALGGANDMTPIGARATLVPDVAFGAIYRRGVVSVPPDVDVALTASMSATTITPAWGLSDLA